MTGDAMFTISGTWQGRRVGPCWSAATLSGDREFDAAVRARAELHDPYEVLLVAATMLDDDEAFQLGGDVPAFDERTAERAFREAGRNPGASNR